MIQSMMSLCPIQGLLNHLAAGIWRSGWGRMADPALAPAVQSLFQSQPEKQSQLSPSPLFTAEDKSKKQPQPPL